MQNKSNVHIARLNNRKRKSIASFSFIIAIYIFKRKKKGKIGKREILPNGWVLPSAQPQSNKDQEEAILVKNGGEDTQM